VDIVVDKSCSKCGQIKSLDYYHKDKTKRLGVSSACKTCVKSSRNNDRKREYSKEYTIRNKDKINDYSRRYYIKMTSYEKRLAEHRKINRNPSVYKERKAKSRFKIDDVYVKQVLRNANINISPETIQLKREQIKIKRLRKKLKDYVKQKTTGTSEQ